MKKIGVIVPCWNEEEALPLFYQEMTKVMDEMKDNDFEIMFINDGSKDNTLQVIKELAKKDKRVRFISFSRNFGKEAAIFAGLQNINGDYVTLMDADLQDPPAKLIEMYETLQKNNLDIVGLKTNNHKNYGFLRKFLTACYYKIIGLLSTVPMAPNERDYRLMTRQVVDAILELTEYNRYSKGLFNFVGFDTLWLTYDAPDRVAGKTTFNFRRLFAYALDGIVGFSTRPLLISSFVGILFCFIALLLVLIIIAKTLIWGDPVSGWPSLACIIIFVSGVQLFFLGVLGEYLAKIYLETKNRPIYIVKETEKDQK
ncbi:MAG: glycosyltransferase family 2 protein [Bacilli bacterium]|nr:glycosyltransferase family 2 protein [Bacilli bacterium]